MQVTFRRTHRVHSLPSFVNQMQRMQGRKPRTRGVVSEQPDDKSWDPGPWRRVLGQSILDFPEARNKGSLCQTTSFKVVLWTNMLYFYKQRNSSQIDEAAAAKNITHTGITKKTARCSPIWDWYLLLGLLLPCLRNSTLTGLYMFSAKHWIPQGSWLIYPSTSSTEAMVPNELDSSCDEGMKGYASSANVIHLFGPAYVTDNIPLDFPWTALAHAACSRHQLAWPNNTIGKSFFKKCLMWAALMTI